MPCIVQWCAPGQGIIKCNIDVPSTRDRGSVVGACAVEMKLEVLGELKQNGNILAFQCRRGINGATKSLQNSSIHKSYLRWIARWWWTRCLVV